MDPRRRVKLDIISLEEILNLPPSKLATQIRLYNLKYKVNYRERERQMELCVRA